MAKSNFERMIELVDEVFDSRNDSQQLDVNEEVMKKLQNIHSATLSEFDDGNGPAVWILLIPTTNTLMQQFLNSEINEQELLDKTPLNISYQSIYLCSALVLPEYRQKGIATKLTLEAIESIRTNHPIESLFVWPFSKEGEKLSKKIADSIGLPIFQKSQQ